MSKQNGAAPEPDALEQARALVTMLEQGGTASTVTDEKCMDDVVAVSVVEEAPRPYGGAKSFSELSEYQQGQKADFATQDLFYAYEQLVANIRADDEMDVRAKGSAIVAASRELSSLLKNPESGATQVGFREKLENAIKAVGGLIVGGVENEHIDRGPQGMFSSFKDATGEWRWLAIHTNKFQDREKEIFPEAAHKQYVEMADALNIYPELWLWHTPGSRVGYADFVEYDHGFMLSSGRYDPGMEHVAEALAKDSGDLGVSHGYRYPLGAKEQGEYSRYFTFEVSPLPAARASNPWVLFNSWAGKEAEMREDKQAFLERYLGAEKVAKIDGALKSFEKELEDAGVSWKEVNDALTGEGVAAAATPASETPVTDAIASPDPVASIADATAAAADAPAAGVAGEASAAPPAEEADAPLADQVKQLAANVDTLTGLVTTMADGMKAMQQSDDSKIAEALAPRRPEPATGPRPTESGDNIMQDEKARAVLDAANPNDAPKNAVTPYVEQLMGLTAKVPQG